MVFDPFAYGLPIVFDGPFTATLIGGTEVADGLTGASDATGDVGIGKGKSGEGTDEKEACIGTILGSAGEHEGNGDTGSIGHESGHLGEDDLLIHKNNRFSRVVNEVEWNY